MLGMLFFILRIDEYIINEHHHKLILGMNTEFIRYMKCAGAFVNPKDMTRYSYSLYLVEKAVLCISSGQILI
jgi:negative regulator of sigma E activity